MKEGAKLFEGYHNYKRYCTKPTEETKVEREIVFCRIEENKELTAYFFPERKLCFNCKRRRFFKKSNSFNYGSTT